MQLTPTQCRLDDVGGIHGPLGRTGAHDRVQLVNEEDDVLVFTDLIHHRLDPLLELAAVLCAGDHQSQIERDDAFFRKKFRNVSRDDLLGKSLRNRGLADPSLPDQDRIILAATAENLDDPLDFLRPADDGIEIPLLGQFRQIPTKCL